MTAREKEIERTRRALRQVGKRRKNLRRQDGALRRDTEKALRAARGLLSVEEAAELAGVGRATAYQSYLGDQNGKADASRKSGRGKSKRRSKRSTRSG